MLSRSILLKSHLRRGFHSSLIVRERRWSRWEWPSKSEASQSSNDGGTSGNDGDSYHSYGSFSFFRDVGVPAVGCFGMISGIYAFSRWYEQQQQRRWKEAGLRKLSYLFPARLRLSYSWRDIHSLNDLKRYLNYLYQTTPSSKMVCGTLVALNAAVFLAWRLPNPRLQLLMHRYFVHHVRKSSLVATIASIPLSTFSHRDGYHILFNMMAGTSFAHVLLHDVSVSHFWAFYLSAGILSTFASHCSRYLTHSHVGGLGASGAIMAIIGYTIARFYHTDPERKFVSLIFLPFVQFNAEQALYALLAAELAMFLFSKRVRIDHVAHLSGLAIGWSYYRWGKSSLWPVYLK